MDIKAFIQTLIKGTRGPCGARAPRGPGVIRGTGGTKIVREPAVSMRGIVQGNTSNAREYARKWRRMLT